MKTVFNVIVLLFIIFGFGILFLFYYSIYKKVKMNENDIEDVNKEIRSMKFKIDLVKKKFETNAKRFSSIENDVDRIGAKIRKLDKSSMTETSETPEEKEE